VHLSAGDLLRAERNDPRSEFGELISSYIKEGKIVPVEITVKLLLNAMKESGRTNFLVDGFPRNADNLDGWKRVVGDQAEVLGCLFFDCPEETMEARLLLRGESSGRSDDNIESIRKRFHTYQQETTPIIDIFKNEGRCWRIVSDRPMEAIRDEVRVLLSKELGFVTDPYGIVRAAHQVEHQVEELPPRVRVAIGVAFAGALLFALQRAWRSD